MVRFFMDVHVPKPVTDGLRARQVDVLTAQEDSAGEISDPELLDRATQLGRVLFTQDDDLLSEAARRQEAGESFAGVVYIHQRKLRTDSYGRWIEELELITRACDAGEIAGRIQFLPLQVR
jgi:predicted nuclease of predicted toxin-antitoxin system